MATLAEEVSKKTGMDVDFVEACIAQHQDRFPASWQDWTVKDRTKTMSSMIKKALKAGEKAPARIVEFYG